MFATVEVLNRHNVCLEKQIELDFKSEGLYLLQSRGIACRIDVVCNIYTPK